MLVTIILFYRKYEGDMKRKLRKQEIKMYCMYVCSLFRESNKPVDSLNNKGDRRNKPSGLQSQISQVLAEWPVGVKVEVRRFRVGSRQHVICWIWLLCVCWCHQLVRD